MTYSLSTLPGKNTLFSLGNIFLHFTIILSIFSIPLFPHCQLSAHSDVHTQRKITVIWELLYFPSPNPNLICPHAFLISSPVKIVIFHLCSGSHFPPCLILPIVSSLLTLQISLPASSLASISKYAFKNQSRPNLSPPESTFSPKCLKNAYIWYLLSSPSHCSTHSKYSFCSHKSITQ